MHKAFKASLGFAAAAALLSGVAYAEAPTFSADIPTVVISDETTVAGTFDNPAGLTGSFNLFRYTDAFSLSAYINPGTAGLSNVRYLFNEFATAGGPIQSGSNAHIAINGATGAATVPSASDILASGALANAGALDFRNINLSPTPGDGPFSAPSGLPSERFITMYIAGLSGQSTLPAGASKTFSVITTTGIPDQLTEPASIFTPFDDQGGAAGFAGWTYSASGGAFTRTPAGTPSSSDPLLSITGSTSFGTGTQFGAASWSSPLPSTAAATVYRVRYTVNIPRQTAAIAGAANPSADAGTHLVRFRAGSFFAQDAGSHELHFARNASSAPVGDNVNLTDTAVVSTYAFFKNAPQDATDVSNNIVVFDVIDASDTVGQNLGHAVNVSRVTIDSASYADLTASGANSLLNMGTNSVPTDSGITPRSGAVPMAAGSIGGAPDNSFVGFVQTLSGTATGATQSLTGGALRTNIPFQAGLGLEGQVYFYDNGGFTLANNKLYVTNVWMRAEISASAPGTQAAELNANAPTLRVRYSADDAVGFNHGIISMTIYDLAFNPSGDAFGGASYGQNPSGLRDFQPAKVYTSIFAPVFNTAAQTDTRSFLNIELLANSAIRIPFGAYYVEKVEVTEYNIPE